MGKLFKYIFFASLYTKAKKSVLMLFICTVVLIAFSFMMNDVMDVATGVSLYIAVVVKWVGILMLFSVIGMILLRIKNALAPTSKKEEIVVDTKKEKLLNKEKIFTKSDSILEKYTKAK